MPGGEGNSVVGERATAQSSHALANCCIAHAASSVAVIVYACARALTHPTTGPGAAQGAPDKGGAAGGDRQHQGRGERVVARMRGPVRLHASQGAAASSKGPSASASAN